MSKTRRTFFLTLLAASVMGVGTLRAADRDTIPTPSPAEPTQASLTETADDGPLVFTGKIVVVDKNAGTITLLVEEKVRQFKLGRNVRIARGEKRLTLAELAPGQQVTVLTRASESGVTEVVALAVKSNVSALQAAGEESPKTESSLSGQSVPFKTLVNPANSQGVVISPSE